MFSKDHPFSAPIVERYSLCSPDSPKKTYHISFDLSGSGIQYKVGDSFGIFPQNDPEEVETILKKVGAKGFEEVVDRKGNKTPFREYLLTKASLDSVTLKLFAVVYEAFEQKPPLLQELKEDQDPSALKFYLQDHHVWDFLEEWSFNLTPQQIVDSLLPLMPRFYSVASSQTVVGDRVDLSVADVSFTSNGHLRNGVCSNYICRKMALFGDKVPIFHQPSHAFSLVEDAETPIIMIGPGTGVAPFRGFMQERLHHRCTSNNWLFFGERHEKENFFYRSFWEELVEKKFLRLTTAFSRDQAHKIYVQHRMKEHGKELFEWLERGAYLYVCGDAKRMAKDVEAVLLEIVAEYGHVDPKAYLKDLRSNKRYLRDVY